MTEFEEKLILLVQKYKVLYDMSDKNYSNHEVKDNIWTEIGQEINIPAIACKSKWKSLRDSYRKAIKFRKSKSGDAAKKKRPWKFEKEMAFLSSFIEERRQISNLSSKSDEDQDDSVTSDPESQPSTSTVVLDASDTSLIKNRSSTKRRKPCVAEVLETYLDTKKSRSDPMDNISRFFLSMAETVKILPRSAQIDIKAKVFQLVHEAELNALHSFDIGPTLSHSSLYKSPQTSPFTWQPLLPFHSPFSEASPPPPLNSFQQSNVEIPTESHCPPSIQENFHFEKH